LKLYRYKDNHFDLIILFFKTFYRDKINFMNFMILPQRPIRDPVNTFLVCSLGKFGP